MSKHNQPFMMTRNAPAAVAVEAEYQRQDLTVRQFQLRAETVNEDARSVDATIATEAPTLVMDLNRWEVVEEILLADGMRVAAADGQVPLLDTHNRASVSMQLGSCRNIRAEGDKIIGTNHFSSVQAAVDCFTKITEGHVRDNSVGYQVQNFVTIEPGMTAEVNGRQFTANEQRPLRVTTEWVIKENSVCPIGADAGAKMRGESVTNGSATNQPNQNPNPRNNQPRRNPTMNDQVRSYLESCGLDANATEDQARAFIATLTDDQRAAMPAETTEPIPAPRPAITDDQRAAWLQDARDEQNAIIAAERTRVSGIRTEGAAAGISQAVIDTCIENGSDIGAARAAFLTDVRETRPSVGQGVNVQVPGREFTARHLSASMLMRGNADPDMLVREFGEDVVQQTTERCRRVSMIDMCRHGLALSGHDVPYDRDDMIRAGFSTGTLPTILGDVAHKQLLSGFNAAEATWQQWCSVKDVSDFKDQNLVRLNVNGGLEKVGNGGEVKTFERSEDKRLVSADEYAKNLSITRRDIINDDAGAFMDIAKKLGKKANHGISDLVYTVLQANVLADGDSTALFSATAHEDKNGDAIVNLLTSNAMAIATLSKAVAYFRKFREFNGDPIDVNPFAILCPPELEGLAATLVSSAMIVSGNTTAAPAQNPNARHNLGVISESRLSNANYDGYSATSWYVVPRAGDVDLMSVAFLNGVQTPQLGQFTCSPDRLGSTWQILLDYGVAATDIYGVKNTA